MANGVGFVKSCLKDRADAIEEFALRSEGFRDLCDDFEIANNEKVRRERSTAPERDERLAEYRELIDSMRAEIEQTLDRPAVFPFKPPRR
ncbi:hypothetical protein U8P80_30415 (plasmid) [Rhizobium beringeri]|uniref:hypothetical protein n=1 Tax=Rhizobium TaxID=379 RepID=UPI001030EA67|nr:MULTISPECIES: hypothetical protein [Rhizobium]NKL65391.1 hypothetical protein [Rhizobium leguminosarum bv. viciae]TBC88561.1 hypothetical protein ELH26_30355 [Rhizobium leguminosarum]TBC89981.1 hypothetical protein ELH21_31005 [Rhizobium leguminosarum]WSG77733.1 hypothetical protein U8P80_30415 [Rhizobium beringeri]WSH17928.1 hypothetical protein U8P74_30415 [Rhizobium beringeri]